MKKQKSKFVAILVFFCCTFFVLTIGCSKNDKAGTDSEILQVVVTLSFFEDMVSQVGGEHIQVTALIPVGVEPEDYEPVPADIRAINDATLFIYNGHNMERWLPSIISDFASRENFYALAEQEEIETIPLPEGPFAGDPDPHVWTDVKNAIIYVQKIYSILADASPENRDYFKARTQKYVRELDDLNSWIKEQVEKIPHSKRVLITSELCFQYFARAYGFFHDAIWTINAPEEGTPAQIIRIIDVLRKVTAPSVFVENQVDHRPMERVSRETGISIGGILYSDSLSQPGEGGETYIKMMRSNVKQMVEALTGKESD